MFSLIALLLFSKNLLAASCCGGGANFPALITGDYKAQLSTSITNTSVVGHTTQDNKAIFHADDNNESSRILKIIGSYQVSDFWQVGAGLPIVSRKINRPSRDAATHGIGDVSLHTAYEFLPEFGYSEWKPRGFLFAQILFPTAPSIHKKDVILSPESARGQGFTTLSTGFSFFKIKGNWDFQWMGQLDTPIAREFDLANGSLKKHKGAGWSSLLAFGHSPAGGDWRLGMGLAPKSTGALRNDNGRILADSQFVWDTSFSLSYLYSFLWSINATYTDQTIMGPSRNAPLSRTVSVLFQRRWGL
jgi:hypothetical protein